MILLEDKVFDNLNYMYDNEENIVVILNQTLYFFLVFLRNKAPSLVR